LGVVGPGRGKRGIFFNMLERGGRRKKFTSLKGGLLHHSSLLVKGKVEGFFLLTTASMKKGKKGEELGFDDFSN